MGTKVAKCRLLYGRVTTWTRSGSKFTVSDFQENSGSGSKFTVHIWFAGWPCGRCPDPGAPQGPGGRGDGGLSHRSPRGCSLRSVLAIYIYIFCCGLRPFSCIYVYRYCISIGSVVSGTLATVGSPFHDHDCESANHWNITSPVQIKIL